MWLSLSVAYVALCLLTLAYLLTWHMTHDCAVHSFSFVLPLHIRHDAISRHSCITVYSTIVLTLYKYHKDITLVPTRTIYLVPSHLTGSPLSSLSTLSIVSVVSAHLRLREITQARVIVTKTQLSVLLWILIHNTQICYIASV